MTTQTVTLHTLDAVTQAYSQLHREQSAEQEEMIRNLQRQMQELRIANEELAGRVLAQEETIQQQASHLRAVEQQRLQNATRRLQEQKRQQELLIAQRVKAIEAKHAISEQTARLFLSDVTGLVEDIQKGQAQNQSWGAGLPSRPYMDKFCLGYSPAERHPWGYVAADFSYLVYPTPENLAYFTQLKAKYSAIVADFQRAKS